MGVIDATTTDCFNAVIQLRKIDERQPVDSQQLHATFIGFVDGIIRRGRHGPIAEHDVQDVAYAMVALVDETALRIPGRIRDKWMSHPLQLHFFNENLAGEGFFARVERMLGDRSRREVLRVYYVCLLLGFQGKYSVRGGDLELAVVLQRVEDALFETLRAPPLSVRHLRPRERISRRSPSYLTIWTGLCALLFSFAMLIVLRHALDGRMDTFRNDLAPLLRKGP